ncbi:MAG: hypothetical protein KGY70_20030 [Bacteroidales bacterium]|nr:hypothetical protein [Bacteroidales bacterium]
MKVINNILVFTVLICLTVSFAYAQDGQSRATAGGGASFSLEPIWSTQTDSRWEPGEAIGDVEDGITAEFVEFSADGKLLVTANGLGKAFVLNAADGTIEQTFTYITDEEISSISESQISGISGGLTKSMEVECAAFTPDGRFLVLGGNLNGAKIFDLSDGSLVRHIKEEEEIDGLMISPDGRFFAHGSHRSARVYNAKTWELIKQVPYGKIKGTHGPVINSIDFATNADLMVLGGNYGHVQLNNTRDWKQTGDGFIQNTSSIKSVRFSPDERLVCAGYGGGEITVWRVRDMSLVKQFSSLVYIEAVAWSSDGRYLMAGGRDDSEGRLRVYRTSDWQMVGNPEVQADAASIEYIDIHGDLVAIAGEDAHVRLYRIKNPE